MKIGDEKEALFISADDIEPIVGFAAFLPDEQWRMVRQVKGILY